MALPRNREGVMPRFFFDLAGDMPEADLDGLDLADLDQARSQATRFVGELLQHDGRAIWDGADLRVEVSDAGRVLLFVVTVSATDIFPGT